MKEPMVSNNITKERERERQRERTKRTKGLRIWENRTRRRMEETKNLSSSNIYIIIYNNLLWSLRYKLVC